VTITPTLIARELPFARGSFYPTTAGCERLDVVCEPVSTVPTSRHRYRLMVFDRDDWPVDLVDGVHQFVDQSLPTP
jgi:hypothetical protein